MSYDFRHAIALGMLFAATACHSKPEKAVADDAARTPIAGEQATRPTVAPVLNADGSFDAKAIMAENDRVIAENERVSKAVESRQRTDPEKYGRLRSECEARLGAPSDVTSAKEIISCVDQAW